MFKQYFSIIESYFALGANSKTCLTNLFVSALLRSITILTLPYFAAEIIKYTTAGDFPGAYINVALLAICFIIYNFAHHYNFVSYSRNSEYVHNALQRQILDKVSSLDAAFSKDISSSFITNTAFNDVYNVMRTADFIFDAAGHSVSIIVALVIITFVNPLVGGFAILLNLFALYLGVKAQAKRNFYLSKQRDSQDQIVSLMGQVVDGGKEIKSFNMDTQLNDYLATYEKSWEHAYFKKRKCNDRFFVLVPTVLGFGKILVYAAFIFLIFRGQAELATLVLVIGYFEDIQSKNDKLFSIFDELSRMSVRIDRLHKILGYKTRHMLTFGTDQTDKIKGRIRFEDVTFTYEKQETLKNASFDIPPKTLVAVVGKSGSGKSTIFRILLRLFKIKSGKVYIDNTEINDFSKEVYSSNVSIVTQKPFIFDMSIRENLNLVDTNSARQIAACKKVGLHDFIMSLPKGYDTKLVQDADNLSSGQKQLLAFARTLLSKSEILLFDEVTSNLDIATTKHVIDLIRSLKHEHTILMITHKPQLMKLADRILVVHDGHIVGSGTHQELIDHNEHYQRLQK